MVAVVGDASLCSAENPVPWGKPSPGAVVGLVSVPLSPGFTARAPACRREMGCCGVAISTVSCRTRMETLTFHEARGEMEGPGIPLPEWSWCIDSAGLSTGLVLVFLG